MSTVVDLVHYAIAARHRETPCSGDDGEVLTPFVLPDAASTGYDLGWRVETDHEEARQRVYPSGGATGGAAFVVRAPYDGLAILVVCNLDRPDDLKKLAVEMARGLLAKK